MEERLDLLKTICVILFIVAGIALIPLFIVTTIDISEEYEIIEQISAIVFLVPLGLGILSGIILGIGKLVMLILPDRIPSRVNVCSRCKKKLSGKAITVKFGDELFNSYICEYSRKVQYNITCTNCGETSTINDSIVKENGVSKDDIRRAAAQKFKVNYYDVSVDLCSTAYLSTNDVELSAAEKMIDAFKKS